MKYMGAKTTLLGKGLGDKLVHLNRNANRFVDLFSGAGNVAIFLSERVNKPVLAADIQQYSRVLSGAIIQRTRPLRADRLIKIWLDVARAKLDHNSRLLRIIAEIDSRLTASSVHKARLLCKTNRGTGIIWRAYGGYYFSPYQSACIDILRRTIPQKEPARSVCLASLVIAASQCAAAPGHTAQPFQPSRSAKRYLAESWEKNVFSLTQAALEMLAPRHAKVRGKAVTIDAQLLARKVRDGDLVFIDPPYSDVQYSRFYHVLESIATGKCGHVSGSGRYPAIEHRPQSDFSKKSTASKAIANLFERLSKKKVTVVVTYPSRLTSNALSGRIVKNLASRHFQVSSTSIYYSYSTLGGNNSHRSARKRSKELILTLRKRKVKAK